MKKETLVEYIKENLDENDIFTKNYLPDSPHFVAPYFLGTDDSYAYIGITEEIPAKEIIDSINIYLADSSAENLNNLELTVLHSTLAEMHNDFFLNFLPEEDSKKIFELAKSFFYKAEERNLLKFALYLFHYQGYISIKENYPSLWEDILSVIRCEEFTYAFIVSAYNELKYLQQELWDLVLCTKNWGRVYVLGELKITTDDQKLWCLESGMDIEVSYPLLSAKLLDECNILKFISPDTVTPLLYNGISSILVNYTELINDMPEKELQKIYKPIPLKNILSKFLYHASRHAVSAKQIINLAHISYNLTNLYDNNKFTYLSLNEYQHAIAELDKIIFSKDWDTIAKQKMILPDYTIDYNILELAQRLDIDIWEDVFAYYKDHFMDTKLFPYLVRTASTEQLQLLFDEMDKHILYYLTDPLTLTVPLLHLRLNPGQGKKLLCEVLKSKVDYGIFMAVSVLTQWPIKDITQEIYTCLLESRKYFYDKHSLDTINTLIHKYQKNYNLN